MNRLALGIVIFALIAIGMMPIVSATEPSLHQAHSPRMAQDAVTIVALDSLQFDPSEVTVSPGQVVVVVNEGVLQHNLAIDEWEVDTGPLNNGEISSFTVPADAVPGTSVEYHCTVPGHTEAGQTGTFTVTAVDDSVPTGQASGTASEPAAVSAVDIAFEPAEIEVFPGQQVTVTNEGMLQHGLVVDEWSVDVGILDGGEQGTFTVPDDVEVGSTVTFYCPVPGHRQAGMEGTFIVVAPPSTGERSAIADLEATIAALEQRQADLAATATAVATEQAQIEEQIVALEIQRNALIEATAAAQQMPTPTLGPSIRSDRPERPAPDNPTPTPQA